MWTCNQCGKEYKSLRSLSVHKWWHSREKKCNRPLIPFENLKKDLSRKTRLIQERGHRCEVCKNSEWMERPIPIELDHIDGHPGHNEKSNLRLICPNCHAQTPHYKGANAGKHTGTDRQKTMAKYPDYRKIRIASVT